MAAVRRGQALRAVARQFQVSLRTVQRWVQRAQDQRLDRVDWSDHPSGARRAANRCASEVEELVLTLRLELRGSDLGEWGAEAIRHAWVERGALPEYPVPCARTIHRILERQGTLDARRRQRQPAPPRGWYLPDVAAARSELDQYDVVSGLVIRGGPEVEVLTAISLPVLNSAVICGLSGASGVLRTTRFGNAPPRARRRSMRYWTSSLPGSGR